MFQRKNITLLARHDLLQQTNFVQYFPKQPTVVNFANHFNRENRLDGNLFSKKSYTYLILGLQSNKFAESVDGLDYGENTLSDDHGNGFCIDSPFSITSIKCKIVPDTEELFAKGDFVVESWIKKDNLFTKIKGATFTSSVKKDDYETVITNSISIDEIFPRDSIIMFTLRFLADDAGESISPKIYGSFSYKEI